MIIKPAIKWLRTGFSLPRDRPELLQAQFTSLTRLIPLMYFILIANCWILAATFLRKAPAFLTIYLPSFLAVACVVRLTMWWRSRHAEPAPELALRELRRTNWLAAVLSLCFLAWGRALLSYGDEYAQSHVAFFLANSTLATMLCLIHSRPAALIVACVSGGACVIIFTATGIPSLMAMAVNVMFVIAAAVIVVLMHNRDFALMVAAQSDARQQEREQTRLLRMIDDMPLSVMTVDPETWKITYANETAKAVMAEIEHLLPVQGKGLVGSSIDMFDPDAENQHRILSDPANLPHKSRIRLGGEVIDLQAAAVRSSEGDYLGPMVSLAVVTKEVEADERIVWLAHHDTLTGLPNRATFHRQLEERLANPANDMTLLFVDLDGFKLVNDSMGHRVGDVLLSQVAERLRKECSDPDVLVGRLGGDEFSVLLPYSDIQRASAFAEKLIGALSEPYRLDDERQVQIGASIGIASAPIHGEDSKLLLSRADIALSVAKSSGKGVLKLFELEMEVDVHERVLLEGQLREALREKEGLFVFYQPIVDIATGEITAREALVRWYHPLRGWVPPSEFIPIAEQCGLIRELGLFVLRRACNDAVGWKDSARIAVNVSPGQLGRGTLAATVLAILVETGLSPNRLEVEITETALLNEEIDGIHDLRQLHDMGVRVALDDFGTGYSSLAHLRMFPFDKIKIDGSFVRDAVTRPDCAAVVRVVADLGRRLGVTTVAEGVESRTHLKLVREEGCTEVQGHLFGAPMPNEADFPVLRQLAALEG